MQCESLLVIRTNLFLILLRVRQLRGWKGAVRLFFLAFALQVHSVTNKNVNSSRYPFAFPNG